MSYLGRSAKLSLKAQEKVSFLATAGQTSKTGLSYTPSFIEVYVNGVLLTDTTDFTATNGNSITFTVALLLNDEVTVISLKTFTVADHYNKTEADTLLAAKATNTALALKAPIASPVFTGNVGIGVTPESDIVAGRPHLRIGTTTTLSGSSNNDQTYLSNNAKQVTTSHSAGWEYLITDHASQYKQLDGTHNFQVAPSGSADAAITFATAMTIDNAGRVTKPLQPSFRVGSVTYVGTGTTILHTIDFHDIGNNYNPANGRFTAPVAGVYYFGAQAISGSATTSSEQNLKFMKNGSAVCDARARSYTESSLHLKTVIELAVGDYMNVVVDSGSVYAQSNGFHNQFMGYLIG